MKLLAIVFLWGIVAQAQIKWGVEAKAGITAGGLYGVSSPEWVMESASGLQIGGLYSCLKFLEAYTNPDSIAMPLSN